MNDPHIYNGTRREAIVFTWDEIYCARHDNSFTLPLTHVWFICDSKMYKYLTLLENGQL